MAESSSEDGKKPNPVAQAKSEPTNDSTQLRDHSHSAVCSERRAKKPSIAQCEPTSSQSGWSRKDKWEIGLLTFASFFAFVAAVAAGFSAYYAIEDVGVAEDTLKETRKAARNELRAYVFANKYKFVNNVKVGGDTHTIIGYRNSGQTPALDAEIRGNITFNSTPPKPNRTVFLDSQIYDQNITIDQKANITPGSPIRPKIPIKKEQIRQIEAGEIKIFVYGTITYKDVFLENTHHTFFCFIYGGLVANKKDLQSDLRIASEVQGNCRTPRPD